MNLVSVLGSITRPSVTLSKLLLLSGRQFPHEPNGIIGFSGSKITGNSMGLESHSESQLSHSGIG